jgi:uncharacterized membrane protein
VTAQNIILVVAAMTTALMAGLFYAFSCAVNFGLARLPDAEYISAMQSINRAVQNPFFFAAFFGAPILLPLSAFLHCEQTMRFRFLLAATVVYLIGVFGVAVFGNVPLNNALDRFDFVSASDEKAARRRANFERSWNNLNHARTFCATLAVILTVVGCLS